MYELTDNIGNVRAVINSLQVDGDVKLESFADYYSFGLPMPGQHANTQEYELDYQGQRKDAETGFNAFELRMFDARIGRWMAPDPYEQHWSPYLAMSNNPIQYIDPDGGSDKTSNEEDFKRLTRETREAALAKFHGDVNSETFADISPRDQQDIINMNPHMRDQLQNYFGSTAAAQDINRIFTLATLGGYKDKDGKTLHALNGKLGYYVKEEGKFKNVPPTLKTIEGITAMTYEPADIIAKFIPISGGGGDPTYSYNGQSGLSSMDLYTSILIDQAAKQFGITDIAALGAAITGAPLLPTRGKFEGATKGTSIASKYLSNIRRTSPVPLPTITGYPTALGGKGMRVMMTNVIGRFVGRTVPIVGWGILTYDIGMTLYNTQVEYNRITGGGQ